MTTRQLLPRVSVAFAALVFLAYYIRIFYGLDFTDEAHYVAIPYVFSIGGRPYVNEATITQNGGILLWPLVQGFTALTGSQAGIVLFIRHLYVILSLVCAAISFRAFRTRLPWAPAFLLSFCIFTFVPFPIPSLSYNTLGSFGVYAGLMCFISAHVSSRPWLGSAVGAGFLATASYAYPTLTLMTSVAGLVHVVLICRSKPRDQWRRVLIAVSIVGVLSLIAVAITLSYAGPDKLRWILRFYAAHGVQGGGVEKALSIAKQLQVEWQLILSFALMLGVLAFLSRFERPWAAIAAMGANVLFAWVLIARPVVAPAFTVIFIGILPIAPAIWLWKGRSPDLRPWVVAWGCSVIAGLICAWTSSNGLYNSSLGLLAAEAVNLAVFGSFVLSRSRQKMAPFVQFLMMLSVVQVGSIYLSVYRDGPFPEMTRVVSSGAYRGLITAPEKVEFIERLTSELDRHAPGRKTVFFFNDFPGGYLLTSLAPGASTLWIAASGPWMKYDRSIHTEYFEGGAKLPDVAVHILVYPGAKGVEIRSISASPDPVLNVFENPSLYRVSARDPNFVFYTRITE